MVTNLSDVSNQVQSFWSDMFMKELRATLLLGSLVNKDYSGEIKQQGDTVYVSQVNAPTGQLLSQSDNTFSPETLSTSRVSVTANKRAIASFEFQDLVELQSQIGAQDSEIRRSLLFAVESQINTYLYSLVSPSTSAPDHSISGVSDFNASQLSACRVLAGQAKWGRDKGWYALLDPQYYGDLMNASTMTSSDYVDDQPVIGGQILAKRFGFNVAEDTSRSADYGLLFHPDFMILCMQKAASFQVSSLHANKQLGYVISCDVVFGAALGINGNVKHIKVYNS